MNRISEEKIKRIKKLAKIYSLRKVAQMVGVSHETVRKYKHSDTVKVKKTATERWVNEDSVKIHFDTQIAEIKAELEEMKKEIFHLNVKVSKLTDFLAKVLKEMAKWREEMKKPAQGEEKATEREKEKLEGNNIIFNKNNIINNNNKINNNKNNNNIKENNYISEKYNNSSQIYNTTSDKNIILTNNIFSPNDFSKKYKDSPLTDTEKMILFHYLQNFSPNNLPDLSPQEIASLREISEAGRRAGWHPRRIENAVKDRIKRAVVKGKKLTLADLSKWMWGRTAKDREKQKWKQEIKEKGIDAVIDEIAKQKEAK